MYFLDIFFLCIVIILLILNYEKYIGINDRLVIPTTYFDILNNLDKSPTNNIVGDINNITDTLSTDEINNYNGIATMLPWSGTIVPKGWHLYLPLEHLFIVKDTRPITYIVSYIEKN